MNRYVINWADLKILKMIVLLIILIPLGVVITVAQETINEPSSDVGVPGDVIPESPDYATQRLSNSWDMTQYSDVSQYINLAGQTTYVDNISVENGIFQARAVNDPNFFVLFPGYETAIHPDGSPSQLGSLYPIDSSQYGCLFLAMFVEVNQSYDAYQVMWFADDRLNGAGTSNWGMSAFQFLYFPEFSAPPPGGGFWKLYQLDLRSVATLNGTTGWLNRSSWQGIRIDPMGLSTQTMFYVDWARLTTCESSMQTITWTPDSSLRSLWVRPIDQPHWVRMDQRDVSGSSGTYQLDVQGLTPGAYEVGLGEFTNSCCKIRSGSNHLVVNQTPIADFIRPSYISGEDFATEEGNPWDFSDATDVFKASNFKSVSIHDGVLDIVTVSGNTMDVDPMVQMNMPDQFTAGDYRYFTFRIYTFGEFQKVPEATIVRFIWTIPSLTGWPGFECHLVSQDVPYDIGWQEVTVDLYDSFGGSAEASAPEGGPHCPSLPFAWLNSGSVIGFRFDPNENIAGRDLHQLVDWIKITKEEQVTRGDLFTIQLNINKPFSEFVTIRYYYTTSRLQPYQHYIATHPSSNPTPIPNRQSVFLPMVMNLFHTELPSLDSDLSFYWDTSSVSPGRYYLCVELFDGLNQATYCSKAPVLVLAP